MSVQTTPGSFLSLMGSSTSSGTVLSPFRGASTMSRPTPKDSCGWTPKTFFHRNTNYVGGGAKTAPRSTSQVRGTSARRRVQNTYESTLHN